MVAITVNALYTAWHKRGTTRQLALAIVCCVGSALLLLPALYWYNVRFASTLATVSRLEVGLMLVYVAIFGCAVPGFATTIYCLFTQPRDSNTSVRIPRSRSKRTTQGNAASIGPVYAPPHRQTGVPAPFVYSDDTPWGWLEYRSGRFQGQKLALKRAIISIGRDEDNDVWLDDDTSSRYHAELSWQEGQTLITDCNSLNGVLLNGRRIRGSVPINSGDLLEIGAHRFHFEIAQRLESWNEQNDPLLHLRRPSSAGILDDDDFLPLRKPAGAPAFPTRPLNDPITPPPMPIEQPPLIPQSPLSSPGICVIRNGAQEGSSFLIDKSSLIVGRESTSDLRIEDASITTQAAQFSHMANGDYVFGEGIFVNEEALREPHLLVAGDVIRLGTVRMEYALLPEIKTTPLPQPAIMPSQQGSSPMHLRLPSKPR